MRLNFEDILLNNAFDLNKGAFYISGNEKTLIKKIEENPKSPKYLQTIRGEGYVLWIE